ncbi:hypothetical protein [Enteractinococcus fodinae]|uniref:Multisubunit Na+/H+ antiporter MnhG subunit n=1 Tax=Enteractinococcus fodinae TaxID=684663 RepID=A0ABU2AZE6_9MICC|nr:hypothetical protein [Enteractinococcus fodinae]MDR7346411.1 multisubunit Na+/H+ antiporter MnhG subunit [Enteractinococcus fodinae]
MSWMDDNPFSTGSRTYQRVLIAGMIILGIGFITAIVGGLTSTRALSLAAVWIMGAGLITHIIAQTIRYYGRRQELKANLEADRKRRQQRGKDTT